MTDLREQFPAFSEFLRGYLHEDFVEEYGSPFQATEAFIGDLSDEELGEVMDEAAELLDVLVTEGFGVVMDILRDLGGAWEPESEAELKKLLTILSGSDGDGEDLEEDEE